MTPSTARPFALVLALVLGSAAAAACQRPATAPSAPPSVTTPAPGTGATTGGDTPVASPGADPMFACSVDADCEVVEMGACDVCNGGWLLSVHVGQAAAARAAYGDPPADACTERGCNWSPTPVCDAGVCARTMDFDSDPATPPQQVANFEGPQGERRRSRR